MDKGLISERLEAIRERIALACSARGRNPDEITLVAAIKKQPVEKVQAYVDRCSEIGMRAVLAENYVQEWRVRRAQLRGNFEAHLIGALQRNKVKDALMIFDLIQAVHSESLLVEINRAAIRRRMRIPIFLQVNVSDDRRKSGFAVRECDEQFIHSLDSLEGVDLRGLMTITRFYEDAQGARQDFAALRALRDHIYHIRKGGSGGPLALSMGMSHDFEVAIEEGASHVRIGTALFGERS